MPAEWREMNRSNAFGGRIIRSGLSDRRLVANLPVSPQALGDAAAIWSCAGGRFQCIYLSVVESPISRMDPHDSIPATRSDLHNALLGHGGDGRSDLVELFGHTLRQPWERLCVRWLWRSPGFHSAGRGEIL